MSWFSDRRLDYVEDYLVSNGKAKPADIAAYFGVSIKSASYDMRDYVERNPHVRYVHFHRAYVTLPGFVPVRGSTQRRRHAWATFK